MQPIVLMNPRRRRRRKSRKARRRARAVKAVTVKLNPRRRRRSRRSVANLFRRSRRNPIVPSGMVQSQLIPAAQGAAGAIALDLALGYLPLPDQLKTGAVRHLVKGALAVGIGMLVEKATSRALGRAAAVGALTVVIHDAAREAIAGAVPQVRLGEYLTDGQLAEYLTSGGRDPDALGYSANPAPMLSGLANYEENTADL